MLEFAASTPTSQSAPRIAAAVMTLLCSEQDQRLLCTALALSRGERRRVKAWSLPDPARMLADRLRATTLGLRGNSEADRALRYMVEASNRGHHVPIQRLSHETQAFAEQLEEIRSFGKDSLLVTGWSSDCEAPSDDCFSTVVSEHRGSVLLVMDAPREPFSASLLVSVGDKGDNPAQLETMAESLEASYPCWMRKSADLAGLEPLLAELSESDFVIVSVTETSTTDLVSLLDRVRTAAKRSMAAVLLPPGGNRTQLLSWLKTQ